MVDPRTEREVRLMGVRCTNSTFIRHDALTYVCIIHLLVDSHVVRSILSLLSGIPVIAERKVNIVMYYYFMLS